MRQIHFAIWDKSICQFRTNIFCNLRQINFAIWDKYILQCETNTFWNLRQMHLAIWNKYTRRIMRIINFWSLCWTEKLAFSIPHSSFVTLVPLICLQGLGANMLIRRIYIKSWKGFGARRGLLHFSGKPVLLSSSNVSL